MIISKQKRAPEVIPTVVPDALADVGRVQQSYAHFSSVLHVDAADGKFAPNTTWMPSPGEHLPDATTVFYEAHMMVENPLSVGVGFARAGAKRIIGHVEAFRHADAARDALTMWKNAGAKQVGLGILRKTPVSALDPYIGLCDCIIVMTIASVGTQGIPFDETAIERVAEIRDRFRDIIIAVDGGVSEKNILRLNEAGASRFSVGSVIAKSVDPAATYRSLLGIVS